MDCLLTILRAILAVLWLGEVVNAHDHDALQESHFFKLRAIPEHNNHSTLAIDNWEVRLMKDFHRERCPEYAILEAPLSSRINEGVRLWMDPKFSTLRTPYNWRMFVGRKDLGYPHRVDFGCKDNATEDVEILLDKGNKAPRLEYNRGTFFACQVGWNVRLFWRQTGRLQDQCVNVKLYVECIKEPDLTGTTTPCCASAWNGTCFRTVEDSWGGMHPKPSNTGHFSL